MEAVAVAVLEALVESVGLPVILSWLSGKVGPTAAQALQAEYAATTAATDAEAKAVLE
jgi:hypothetical protein